MVQVLVLLWALVACLGFAAPAEASHRSDLLAPETVCQGQTDPGLDPHGATRALWCMHNYARRQSGLPQLRPLASLGWSAHRKAVDIQRCAVFSHTACGREPEYWVQRTGLAGRCYRMNENIAVRWPAAGTLRLVMSGWLHSDTHRHTLLMRRARWLGIGLARGPFLGQPDAAIWVTHFGYRC